MRWRKCREEQIKTVFHYDKIREGGMAKRCVSFFLQSEVKNEYSELFVKKRYFPDFIFYNAVLIYIILLL